MKRLLRSLAALGLTTTAFSAALVASPTAVADTQLCGKYDSTSIQGGRYVVQNNEWGDSIPQCITVTSTGFGVTSGNHNLPTTGAPAAYPSIYAGCHYTNCSTGSGLPVQVSRFGAPRSTVSYTTTGGQWDAAYDIWLDTNPNPPGQNNGAEIMIWGAHTSGPQPVGARKATVNLAGATWDVWEGPLTNAGITWNVVSYVRQQNTNTLDVNVKDFTSDAVSRGYAQTSWYLTSVQFGFEPWQGGPGLAVNSFSFDVNGVGGAVSLPVNTTESLQVTTPGLADRYARHQNSLGYTEHVDSASPALLKQDATWWIRPGLSGSGCYSFESKNFPGQYLRHRDFRVRKDPDDGSDLFKRDATWCARPGQSGHDVSLESLGFPGKFLRHYNAELWLAGNGGPNAYDTPAKFADDTTWHIAATWS